MVAAPHTPVFLDRVLELLATAPQGAILDGTLGAAGHASAIVAARVAAHGRAHLVGIDRDPTAHVLARAVLGEPSDSVRIDLATVRFDAAPRVLDELGIERLAGFLLDLGISSMHVDQPDRGFSYRHEGPLDMRMGPDADRTAADVVNGYPPQELTRVLRSLGEEKHAARIVRAIVAARPIGSTTQLADIVRDAVPAAARRTGGHPATKTFQAIRIEVNGELVALEQVLPVLIRRLAPDGVGIVLSYHSLEDRIVKRAFVDAARGCICPPDLPVCACDRVPLVHLVTKRPQRPDADEVARNPRASAGRLRAVVRLAEDAP